MIHRQMVEGFIGTKQRAYPVRKKCTQEREHSGGAELKEHPMAEHIVCVIHVPLADADGIDRHASNADEHIHRAYHQYGGTSQIDRPQRVCPDPSAHKDRVDNGEQEEADIAAYRWDHIPGHSPKLRVVHLITSSPRAFSQGFLFDRFFR